MRRIIIFLLVIFFPCWVWTAKSNAGTMLQGDQILEKVEKSMNPSKDRSSKVEMTLIDSNGNKKIRKMEVLQLKHEPCDFRLVRFLEPAEVAGVGFLSKSDTEMYLYMPAFKKIRRIASHSKNENFMGTDFSYDDMGSTGYTDDYKAVVTSRENDMVVLDLRPKNPDDSEYSKIVMTVDTKTYIPAEMRYFNDNGKLWKVMTLSEVKKKSGYWVPEVMEIKDVIKNHSTKMRNIEILFDTGLSENVFTKRSLRRGR